jgi:hypothetical protein
MEVVASFTVAKSLEGALVHLALVQDRVMVVDGAQDVDEARREALRLSRLLRSAGDVIADKLGDRLEPIRNVVHSTLRSRVAGAGLVSLGSSWVNHEIAFGAQGVIRKRLINEQTGSERRRNESANGI